MNGQMKNYKEYLEKTYEPINVNSLPYFLDMKAISLYAKKRNIKIVELSQDEKKRFLIKNTLAKRD